MYRHPLLRNTRSRAVFFANAAPKYDSATVAWAAAAKTAAGGTAVPDWIVRVVDSGIKQLRAAGLYSKIKRLNFCAGSLAGHAAVPQIGVSGNASDTQVSTPTYTSGKGWTFNGTSYLRTGLIPSSHLTSLNTHLAVLVSKGMAGGANRTILGCSSNSGANRFVIRWLNTNAIQATLESNTDFLLSAGFTGTVPDGLMVASARGANDAKFYRNRAQVATDTVYTTAARPTTEVAVGGWWSGAGITEGCSCDISSYSIGDNLTDAQMDALGSTMNWVHQSLGRELRVVGWGDSMTAAGSSDWLATSQAQDNPYVTYTNRGVGGETSTQIRTRFTAAPELHGYNTVIWAGRNDVRTSPSTARANIAAMVTALGHTRYRVIGVIPRVDATGVDERVGGSQRTNNLDVLNAGLSADYGSKFINPMQGLQTDDGVAWTGQDLTDVTTYNVPPTSRYVADGIHLTTGTATINGRRSGNTVIRDLVSGSVSTGW